jgi:hypothetical protein
MSKPSIPGPGNNYFSNAGLARRYGVDARTIRRWQDDPKLGFPAPDLEINGRKLTREKSVEAFDEHRRALIANDT